MLGSYALAIGHGRHRHALANRAASLNLPKRLETGELLLVADERMCCICDGRSVLVGQAFHPSGDRLVRLPPELAEPHHRDLQPILSHLWGNYAFYSARAEEAFAYREPSGSIPVYRSGGDSDTVFVSDAGIASKLGLLDRSRVDEQFLVHWLQFPFLRTRRTGLDNVSELLPGMCLRKASSGTWVEKAAWHPSTFASRTAAITDSVEAARLLRECALLVVAAQASQQPDLALRLSGGLDSSIIAACLSHSNADFRCINFATTARDGDERDYAGQVARSLGLKLVEVGEPGPRRLQAFSQQSFRPLINPLLAPFEQAMAEGARELGANLLLDGGGGDNLFCSIASAAPVIDALATARIGAAAAAIGDIAVRYNCTFWDIFKAAGQKLTRRRSPWNEDRSFLLQDALCRFEGHPWLNGLTILPGKRQHVEALVHVQHFLDRSPSSIPTLHPLLAQPLLELCLRIPSWLWICGGRDRALARDAFDGLLPDSVVRRHSKGSLQSLLYRSFQHHRLEIRHLLLEGRLAKFGIIDAAEVGKVLTGEAAVAGEVQLRISEMTALELWLASRPSQISSSSTGA